MREFFNWSFLILILFIGFSFVYQKQQTDEVFILPEGVRKIEGLAHSFRSGQLPLEQIEQLLQAGLIKTVIRLNGEGKDAAGVSIEEEAKLCAEYNVRFYHLNAHEGYQKGKGYLSSNQTIVNMLEQDHTYLHCKHGFDRTGSVIAYWMATQGYDAEQIILHNEWQGYLQRKGEAYRKYYEPVWADYSNLH